MKLVNKTRFQTKELRQAVSYALSHWWKRADDRFYRQRLTVEIIDNRTYNSHAYYNGTFMRINLWGKDLRTEKKKFAWTLRHEIYHLNGFHHKDMRGSYFLHWPKEFIHEDWIEQFQFQEKQPKRKPAVNLVEVRYRHATEMMKKAQTRLKRATNIFKRWHKSVRYYEQVALAKTKK